MTLKDAFGTLSVLMASFRACHTAPVSQFCVRCGQPVNEGSHEQCGGLRASLEPPRFCPECARRMVVQVTPAGWSARCSRHGVYATS